MRRLTGKPRRRPARRWFRPALIYGAPLAMMIGLGLAGGWFWASGRAEVAYRRGIEAVVGASARLGWALGEVYVVGRVHTPRKALLAAVGAAEGTPLIRIDATAVAKRIAAIGWVARASVERRFPDTILIRLAERVPLARWQHRGKVAVIARDGTVIAGASPAAFAALPLVVGPDAPADAHRLVRLMASEPPLAQRVVAAVRVGGRRWNLKLDNGIAVKLPEDGLAAAWRRLADYERRYQLLARDITVIDLRLPDRLVVRRAHRNGAGKET